MSFGHAIYYPRISLDQPSWLKSALLYYDQISRIVPHDVEPNDSEEVQHIIRESDFILNYAPEYWDMNQTFRQFGDVLKKVTDPDGFFHDRYFELPYDQRNYSQMFEDRPQAYRQYTHKNGVYIHLEKVLPELREMMLYLGVATEGKGEWSNWLRMDTDIGELYMVFLANSIASKHSRALLTDNPTSFGQAANLENQLPIKSKDDIGYHLGALLIEHFAPVRLDDVPIQDILKIRDRYRSERLAFYNSITNLCKGLQELPSEHAVQDALQFHSKLIAKNAEDLRKAYESFGISTVNSMLSVSVPTTIGTMTEWVPSEYKHAGMMLGLMFGGVTAIHKARANKLKLEKDPHSYLLYLQSELGPANFFQRIKDSMNGLRKF